MVGGIWRCGGEGAGRGGEGGKMGGEERKMANEDFQGRREKRGMGFDVAFG